MAPEPFTIGGVFGKAEAERFEAGDLFVEVVAFEIEDDVVCNGDFVGGVDGKRRFAVGAFEPGVSRQGIDDTFEAKLFEELDGFDRKLGVDSDLVEVHSRILTGYTGWAGYCFIDPGYPVHPVKYLLFNIENAKGLFRLRDVFAVGIFIDEHCEVHLGTLTQFFGGKFFFIFLVL